MWYQWKMRCPKNPYMLCQNSENCTRTNCCWSIEAKCEILNIPIDYLYIHLYMYFRWFVKYVIMLLINFENPSKPCFFEILSSFSTEMMTKALVSLFSRKTQTWTSLFQIECFQKWDVSIADALQTKYTRVTSECSFLEDIFGIATTLKVKNNNWNYVKCTLQ